MSYIAFGFAWANHLKAPEHLIRMPFGRRIPLQSLHQVQPYFVYSPLYVTRTTISQGKMRYSILACIGAAAAAPVAQFDLGTLLGGLGGAGGAGGLGALLGGAGGAGGLDSLLGGLLGNSDGPKVDVSVITGEYEKIKTVIAAKGAFADKVGDKAPADLIQQLNKLAASQIDALKAAAKAFNAMPGTIDIMSVLDLQTTGGELTAEITKSLESLKKSIGAISKVPGAREAELKNLNDMLQATKEFNEAMNKKLPAIAQSVAAQGFQKRLDSIADAIKAFGGK
jgi:hypothetical protein